MPTVAEIYGHMTTTRPLTDAELDVINDVLATNSLTNYGFSIDETRHVVSVNSDHMNWYGYYPFGFKRTEHLRDYTRYQMNFTQFLAHLVALPALADVGFEGRFETITSDGDPDSLYPLIRQLTVGSGKVFEAMGRIFIGPQDEIPAPMFP